MGQEGNLVAEQRKCYKVGSSSIDDLIGFPCLFGEKSKCNMACCYVFLLLMEVKIFIDKSLARRQAYY